MASLVASTALPAGLKLRLATRYLPFLARHARLLDANDPAATGGAELDDSSVTEWGRVALGEDFVELLAYPLLGAYYGGTPERVAINEAVELAKRYGSRQSPQFVNGVLDRFVKKGSRAVAREKQ